MIVSQAVGTSRLDSHVSTIQQQTHPSHWIKQTSRGLHRFRGFPKPSPRTLTISVLGLRSCAWNWMGHLHRKMGTFCGKQHTNLNFVSCSSCEGKFPSVEGDYHPDVHLPFFAVIMVRWKVTYINESNLILEIYPFSTEP